MAYIKRLNGTENLDISTGGASATSSLSVTKLSSYFIQPNTFTTGDYISFGGMFGRNVGAVSSVTTYLYLSTGDTLTGAIQVGFRSISTTQSFFYLSRRLYITNNTGGGSGNNVGTQLISINNFVDDYRTSTTSDIAVDWTSDIYFIMAGVVANAADTITSYGLKVFKY